VQTWRISVILEIQRCIVLIVIFRYLEGESNGYANLRVSAFSMDAIVLG
jgi:hypothetical protein